MKTKECKHCGRRRLIKFFSLKKDGDRGAWLMGKCTDCCNKLRAQHRKDNPVANDKCNRRRREKRLDRRDELNAYNRWRYANIPHVREGVLANNHKSYRENPNREQRNANSRRLYRDDPQVRKDAATRATNRRIGILQRTPPWCDLKAVNEIYKNCPPNRVVDHIIPKMGKLVSGLHVPENLQYLTPHENGAKANKFNPMEFTT